MFWQLHAWFSARDAGRLPQNALRRIGVRQNHATDSTPRSIDQQIPETGFKCITAVFFAVDLDTRWADTHRSPSWPGCWPSSGDFGCRRVGQSLATSATVETVAFTEGPSSFGF